MPWRDMVIIRATYRNVRVVGVPGRQDSAEVVRRGRTHRMVGQTAPADHVPGLATCTLEKPLDYAQAG